MNRNIITQPASDGTAAPLSERQILIVFGGLVLGMLLAALDQTIVSTALPTIVGDLGGLDRLSWVVTIYLLAATASTPLWGKLGDLYGRKRLFQATIVVFLTGSALCGIAQSMGQLIAFRGLQGLGAGGLMTLAMAIVGDIVSPRERGRYQGYISVVFLLASVAGPLLGGTFVDHVSWRWVFYVNLPIGAVALLVTSLVLHAPAQRSQARIDYLGAALLAAAITSLLLLTDWGGNRYAWSSGAITGLAAAGLVLLGLFLLQERRAPEPVLPLRLFRDLAFTVVCATLFIATCSLFAVLVFLPLFLQIVTGASATTSGLLLLPMLIGSTTTTVSAGRIMARTGRYKLFPVVGLALMAVGLFLLSRMDAATTRLIASLFMLVFGLGFGMVSQVLVVAVQNAVDRRDLGTATASTNLFRALGGAVGVAVFGAVFAGRLHYWLPREVPARLGNLDANALQSSPDRIRHLAPPVHEGVVQAVAHATHSVFLVAAPIAALGFLVALLLRERPLRGPAPVRQSSPAQSQAESSGA